MEPEEKAAGSSKESQSKLKGMLTGEKNKRLVVLFIALLLLPITLVLVQRVVRYFSGAASATIYFEPSTADIPEDKTLRLMVDSGTTQVGFARVEINFDTSKVLLTKEVSFKDEPALAMGNEDVTDPTSLPEYACTGTEKCIIKTPMTAANNTGKIILVLAKDPRDAIVAPSGEFELAQFTFTENTQEGVNTTVSIAPHPSHQLVDLDSSEFSVTIENATLALNGGGDLTPTSSPSENILLNPSFELGTNNWKFYTNGSGDFSVSSDAYDGVNSGHITISQEGTNVQLNQTSMLLEPDTEYLLSFAAKSSSGHDMEVKIHRHSSPYTNYGLNTVVNLGTSWQTFSFEFTTSGFSAPTTDTRLRFWLAPYDVPGDEYFIDNVSLIKAGTTAHTPTPIPTNTSTITPTIPPTPTIVDDCDIWGADLNRDDTVNVIDVLIVLDNYTAKPPPPNPNPCADVSGDDKVNVIDVLIVLDNYSIKN